MRKFTRDEVALLLMLQDYKWPMAYSNLKHHVDRIGLVTWRHVRLHMGVCFRYYTKSHRAARGDKIIYVRMARLTDTALTVIAKGMPPL